MKPTILLLILLIGGCTRLGLSTEFKCKDGVLYMRDNGAWIQAKLYEQNKCLPMEDKQ